MNCDWPEKHYKVVKRMCIQEKATQGELDWMMPVAGADMGTDDSAH